MINFTHLNTTQHEQLRITVTKSRAPQCSTATGTRFCIFLHGTVWLRITVRAWAYGEGSSKTPRTRCMGCSCSTLIAIVRAGRADSTCRQFNCARCDAWPPVRLCCFPPAKHEWIGVLPSVPQINAILCLLRLLFDHLFYLNFLYK